MLLNPYASPHTTAEDALEPIVAIDGLTVQRESGLGPYRKIRLAGDIEGTLVWNAIWPVETISFNGYQLAAEPEFLHFVHPHFDFSLPGKSSTWHATLDVRMRWYAPLWVAALRIRLNGQTVYFEGDRTRRLDN